jgi:hypothetical protein
MFLGNGSVNTFLLLGSRFLIMQQLDYNNGNGVFLLLQAVAREWLVKTQQAGKGLVGAVVICQLWRLAVAP